MVGMGASFWGRTAVGVWYVCSGCLARPSRSWRERTRSRGAARAHRSNRAASRAASPARGGRSGRSWLPGSAWPRGAPGEGGVALRNHDNGQLSATSAEIFLSGRARCATCVAWRTQRTGRACKVVRCKKTREANVELLRDWCKSVFLTLRRQFACGLRAWRRISRIFLPERPQAHRSLFRTTTANKSAKLPV